MTHRSCAVRSRSAKYQCPLCHALNPLISPRTHSGPSLASSTARAGLDHVAGDELRLPHGDDQDVGHPRDRLDVPGARMAHRHRCVAAGAVLEEKRGHRAAHDGRATDDHRVLPGGVDAALEQELLHTDRKSTRLNSSHGYISYAVFCLKKKKQTHGRPGNPRTIRAGSNRLVLGNDLTSNPSIAS